jgi:hypothetical protein
MMFMRWLVWCTVLLHVIYTPMSIVRPPRDDILKRDEVLATDWARAGKLEQPRVDACLVEAMLAFAWQYPDVITLFEIDDAYWAGLSAYRVWDDIVAHTT